MLWPVFDKLHFTTSLALVSCVFPTKMCHRPANQSINKPTHDVLSWDSLTLSWQQLQCYVQKNTEHVVPESDDFIFPPFPRMWRGVRRPALKHRQELRDRELPVTPVQGFTSVWVRRNRSEVWLGHYPPHVGSRITQIDWVGNRQRVTIVSYVED